MLIMRYFLYRMSFVLLYAALLFSIFKHYADLIASLKNTQIENVFGNLSELPMKLYFITVSQDTASQDTASQNIGASAIVPI